MQYSMVMFSIQFINLQLDFKYACGSSIGVDVVNQENKKKER